MRKIICLIVLVILTACATQTPLEPATDAATDIEVSEPEETEQERAQEERVDPILDEPEEEPQVEELEVVEVVEEEPLQEIVEEEPAEDPTCSEGNQCDGQLRGSEYRCQHGGEADPAGGFFCTCDTTCEISYEMDTDAFCQDGVQCKNKQKGSSWECGSEEKIDGERKKIQVCSCDQNCEYSVTCIEGTKCYGQQVGVSYRCDDYYDSPNPNGAYECLCNTCMGGSISLI